MIRVQINPPGKGKKKTGETVEFYSQDEQSAVRDLVIRRDAEGAPTFSEARLFSAEEADAKPFMTLDAEAIAALDAPEAATRSE